MGDHPEPIGIIGTGYVGLVTAVGLASLGSDVFCIDIDADIIGKLNAGEAPFFEPGLEEMLLEHRDRLHFSSDLSVALKNARLLFVAVGTPPNADGGADLSYVRRVVDALPASTRHALVMKSTVPAGTGACIKRIFAEQGKPDLAYVSCPEFLKEGSAVIDVLEPDRVVIGDDGDWAGDAVAALYKPLCGLEVPLIRTDITSAEMVKLASNAFLATKISFINEIANVCDRVGADVLEVVRGMGPDTRIGPRFLRAGIGYGGSCFSKDVEALRHLARKHGYKFRLLKAGTKVNELQKNCVVDKLSEGFGGALDGRVICLLGLAFKPSTDDMREASSLALSKRLLRCGTTLRVFDPKVGRDKVFSEQSGRDALGSAYFAADALDAADGADAVVLVTEWAELVALDWAAVAERMAGSLVIDGRNALDPKVMADAGLVYEGVGRGRHRGTVTPIRSRVDVARAARRAL